MPLIRIGDNGHSGARNHKHSEMSGIVLTAAAIMALVIDPSCGAATSGSEFAAHVQGIALHESGWGDALAIGVNADPARGLLAARVRSRNAQEAAARARVLIAQGRSVDLGLMQINNLQLARHHLTVEAAFDPCANIKAGADHYADDVRSVFALASRRYNTGTIEHGAAYADSVEQVLARVRATGVVPVVAVAPAAPIQPAPLPCAPAWDGWALAQCSARQRAPTPAVGSPSAATMNATIGLNANATP